VSTCVKVNTVQPVASTQTQLLPCIDELKVYDRRVNVLIMLIMLTRLIMLITCVMYRETSESANIKMSTI